VYLTNTQFSYVQLYSVVRITSSETYMDRVNMYASFYVGIRHGGRSLDPTKKVSEVNLEALDSLLQATTAI
jgi:hypothetical protein